MVDRAPGNERGPSNRALLRQPGARRTGEVVSRSLEAQPGMASPWSRHLGVTKKPDSQQWRLETKRIMAVPVPMSFEFWLSDLRQVGNALPIQKNHPLRRLGECSEGSPIFAPVEVPKRHGALRSFLPVVVARRAAPAICSGRPSRSASSAGSSERQTLMGPCNQATVAGENLAIPPPALPSLRDTPHIPP